MKRKNNTTKRLTEELGKFSHSKTYFLFFFPFEKVTCDDYLGLRRKVDEGIITFENSENIVKYCGVLCKISFNFAQ
jgi:hypothetical protein